MLDRRGLIGLAAGGAVTVNARAAAAASGDVAGLRAWTKAQGDQCARRGDRYLCDTSAGSFRVALPADPVAGDEVWIRDVAGFFGRHPVVLDRHGSLIGGKADDLKVDVDGVTLVLVFDGFGWTL